MEEAAEVRGLEVELLDRLGSHGPNSIGCCWTSPLPACLAALGQSPTLSNLYIHVAMNTHGVLVVNSAPLYEH